jgi:predicted ester cyclase
MQTRRFRQRDHGDYQERTFASHGGPDRREVVAGGLAFAFVSTASLSACGEARPLQRRDAMMPDPMSASRFAEPLIRIGEIAIARENDAALDAYFAPNFRFHGPAGDLTYEQLKAYFASLRAAFTDLQVRRAAIIGEGSWLASRTVFSGTFADIFTQSPVGPLKPHGRHIEWEVMNLFRYDDEGRLAEEWVQYDFRSFLRKLGAGA